ncbi:MAG: hypothetical protein II875_10285 [Clostridia bacterium]|nr:hypothetical protein [Clostridia bacterium]
MEKGETDIRLYTGCSPVKEHPHFVDNESRFTNLLPQNVPKEFYQLAAMCQKKITDLLPVPKEFYQLAAARDRWSRGCF